MSTELSIQGQRFGLLTAVRRVGQDRWRAWMWECICVCGKTVTVRGATLKAGKTRACAPCASARRNVTHGQTGTPLYFRWRAMLDRCARPGNKEWRNYGGRGIKVCGEWHAFEAFARDMSAGFRPGLELDRINNDGHYEPSNCRWATRTEQQNNRRNNHTVAWRGETRTVREWAALVGVKPNTLLYRLRRGWDLERAMTTLPHVLLEIANTPAGEKV